MSEPLVKFIKAKRRGLGLTQRDLADRAGVGMAAKPPRWLKPGDVVTIEIDRIGALTNPVVLEP